MPRAVRTVAAFLAFTLALAGASCKKPGSEATEQRQSAAAPVPPTVTDSSVGLVFTWIDEKGDFHNADKPGDVPLAGRDLVRVLDPTAYDIDHPDRIFVVDLRTAGPDGAYPVKASTRAELDTVAEARRAKSGITLANAGAQPGANASPSPGQGAPGVTRPAVILYGASWCGACHEAAAYFKRRGIAFIEKDIEADANAAREMQAKLAHAGKRGGSIPVLDVRGKIMVGFNPQEVENALGQAL